MMDIDSYLSFLYNASHQNTLKVCNNIYRASSVITNFNSRSFHYCSCIYSYIYKFFQTYCRFLISNIMRYTNVNVFCAIISYQQSSKLVVSVQLYFIDAEHMLRKSFCILSLFIGSFSTNFFLPNRIIEIY